MPTRTFSGFARSGEVVLPERTVRFRRGEEVEVTADEAALLDQNPDWGGTPVADDLAGLDKDALLTIAETEQVDVKKTWGAKRLADTIREHRAAVLAEVDDPADTEEA